MLTDAFEADPRPLIRELRQAKGLPGDPVAELRASGLAERLARERGKAMGSGGGYPEGA